MSQIEFRGVSKTYGGLEVLKRLDLVLDSRKTYVLIGPSGCGKSTLLKLIVGLVTPDTGAVLLDGVDVSEGDREAFRRRIGYVIQEGGLFPHLTAFENAAIVGRYLGWGRARLAERVGELAELTQFPVDGLGRFPAQLSGGQRQRVGLMRALLLDPAVLLMDEPLGALDPMVRSDLQEDLRGVFQRLDKTVVLVTHDLHEAAFLADEVILMRGGRVVQRGAIADLFEKPAEPFVEQFINAQRVALPGGAG